MPYTDHEGTCFKTKTAMCLHWGISLETYSFRINSGMTMAQALTQSVSHKKQCVDPFGNTYSSVEEMYARYGLNRRTVEARIKHGMTPEQAFTTPVSGRTSAKPVTDHKGITYPSLKTMCRAYHITPDRYQSRIKNGWSQKDALEQRRDSSTTPRKITDHLGNEYPSLTSLAKAYGLSRDYIQKHMDKGEPMEQILTGSPEDRYACTDPFGRKHKSRSEMLSYYQIQASSYFKHRKKTDERNVLLLDIRNPVELDEDLTILDHIEDIYYIVRYQKKNDIWTLHRILDYAKEHSLEIERKKRYF